MLHKSDNESHVHGVFELPHRRLGPDEESAIKSEAPGTVTIKNGGRKESSMTGYREILRWGSLNYSQCAIAQANSRG